jgi:hypothetical protein
MLACLIPLINNGFENNSKRILVFYSGIVGMAKRITIAAITGKKVNINDKALCGFGHRASSQRIHGTAMDTTAIQNTSTTKLDNDAVDPTWNMVRKNHVTTPLNG